MKISGYLGFSLIDYPGKVAFVIFTQGCNFRCPFCHNPELISTRKKGLYSEDFIIEELLKRKKIINAVVITGGEPTIQEDLPLFLFKLKKRRLNIKLDTNGSNPKMLMEIVKSRLVDYVAVDFKTSRVKYHLAIGLEKEEGERYYKKLLESLKILKEGDIEYEVRTTVVPEIVEEEDLKLIRDEIGDVPYYLQRFNPENALSFEFRKKISYPDDKLIEFRERLHCELRGVVNSFQNKES
ncbi:MAG: anaerobic ribonucleoside-triphosphate reductase activating protein [Dictyoglomus sp. NZ13-RE01]|nr:MAG: anaerobic ribonucleoside-triphosphate reductase activating protein [Dictyoglomus sp. NZ13-RE01]